jgi:hypothetical protein
MMIKTAVVVCAILTAIPTGMLPVVATASVDPIITYKPRKNVDSYLNLARDVHAMKILLSNHTDDAFRKAYDVYTKGGYAAPSVEVTLHNELSHHLEDGAVLKATSKQGDTVRVASTRYHHVGETKLHLRYQPGVRCFVGGLHPTEDKGCIEPTGHLEVEGHSSPIYYSDRSSFSNFTLQDLNSHAEVDFRPHGDNTTDYFPEFALFKHYYGTPHFVDKMILAAFDKKSHTFEHQTFDFTKIHHSGRATFIDKTVVYLSTGQYVMRNLNEALVHCHHDKESPHAMHKLDEAVALYTGAFQDQRGSGTSNMLFGLANRMCRHFRTCGEKGESTDGMARVNLKIFHHLDEMQKHLKEGKCFHAGESKKHIVRHMYIPLFQGLIYSAFQKHNGDKDFQDEEGTVFAASILPRLADCSMEKAKSLHSMFVPGYEVSLGKMSDFDDILSTLQSHFECLDIKCEDVGGIWNDDMKQYHKHVQPCTHTHSSSDPSKSHTHSSSSGSAKTTVDSEVDNENSTPLKWIFIGAAVGIAGLTLATGLMTLVKRACSVRDTSCQLNADDLKVEDYPHKESPSLGPSIFVNAGSSQKTDTDSLDSTGDSIDDKEIV